MTAPVILKLPLANGKEVAATVATSNGMCEVDLNGVPHIGVLLGIDDATATIAVLTADEAHEYASALSLAALTLSRRLSGAGKILPGLPGVS